MKAIVISRPGPPEVLQLVERPRPKITETQVLIRVQAAGLNRADIIQREGRYPPPAGAPSDVPGLEVAGVIEERGSTVTRWQAGGRCLRAAGGRWLCGICCSRGQPLPPYPKWVEFN
jgi:NADPH2:quinone reductase